nr:SymE family type I addiction module toxin [Pectobacterium parmentieri]
MLWRARWVDDSGTLTLACDWLTQSGLPSQPLSITYCPVK